MTWDPTWAAPKQAVRPQAPPHVQTEQMLKGIVQESQQWTQPPQSQAPGSARPQPNTSQPGGFGNVPPNGAGPQAQQQASQRPAPPQPIWNGQQWIYPQQSQTNAYPGYPQQPAQMQQRPPQQQVQAPPQQQQQQAPQKPAAPVPATKKKSALVKTLWGLIIVTTALFVASLVYFYVVYVRS